ncbi:recombination regulator RecX [Aquibacillus sp. 3ASR75-11]|uniref:Regulatory protein RecX n=1 Tax=Terrihalobacillus insolitus TaxID=2950438 RepID=A0A9X4AMG4_9BACI|nr:recombination regulator RecX [Terrihalobacillus insolitus]MDC3425276.1 recombination regulator RecX [Terrihalobacillus insolitus]
MDKISRIATQKNSKSRYSIFLTNGNLERYGFSVDEAILVEHQLRKGMELDESTIQGLTKEDTIHKSYSMALHYLSYRMRSEKEMSMYLEKKEVDEEHISIIIQRLKQEGLLNDLEFAEAFVQTRLQMTSKGPFFIRKELIEKGIRDDIIERALSLYTFEDQYQKALQWVNKKRTTKTKKSFQHQLQGLQQNLLQKGFASDVVKEVLKEAREGQEEDSEWEAIVYQGEKLIRKFNKQSEGSAYKQKVKAGLYRKGFRLEYIDRFLEEHLNGEY